MRFSIEQEREIYKKWSQDLDRYAGASDLVLKLDNIPAQGILDTLIADRYLCEYQFFADFAYKEIDVKEALVKLCGTRDLGSYIKNHAAFKYVIDAQTYTHYKTVTYNIDYAASSKLYNVYQSIDARKTELYINIAETLVMATSLSVEAKSSPGWDFEPEAIVRIPADAITQSLQALKYCCKDANIRVSKRHGLLACSLDAVTIYFYVNNDDFAAYLPLLLPKTIAGTYLAAIATKIDYPQLSQIEALTQVYYERTLVNPDHLDIRTHAAIVDKTAPELLTALEDYIELEAAKRQESVAAKILPLMLSNTSEYDDYVAMHKSLSPIERFACKRMENKYRLNQKVPNLKNYYSRQQQQITFQNFRHSPEQAQALRDDLLSKLKASTITEEHQFSSEFYNHVNHKLLRYDFLASTWCEALSCAIQLDEALNSDDIADIAALIKQNKLKLIDPKLLGFELYTTAGPLRFYIMFGEKTRSACERHFELNKMVYEYYFSERQVSCIISKIETAAVDDSNNLCHLLNEADDVELLFLESLLCAEGPLRSLVTEVMSSTTVLRDISNQINLIENQKIYSIISQKDLVRRVGKKQKCFNKIYSNLKVRLDLCLKQQRFLLRLGKRLGFKVGAFITIPRNVSVEDLTQALSLLIKEHGYTLTSINSAFALEKKACTFYCMYGKGSEIMSYPFSLTQMTAILDSRRDVTKWQPSIKLTEILKEAQNLS